MLNEERLPKHHYIPVLYLSQWARNGRFTEFSRPPGRERVEARGTGARGTGYQRGLYRLNDAPPELAEAVERKFMAQVDNLAKDALDILLANSRAPWTLRTRSAWSRFVNGLIFRVPERVASARRFLEEFWLSNYDENARKYAAAKGEDDPEFLDYIIRRIERETFEHIMGQIDNRQIGTVLNRMRWFTIDVTPAGRSLFTSDRPVIMTNGLSYLNSHLLLPISPRRLFLATNNAETEKLFATLSRRELVKSCNRHVVRRAQKFAWSMSDIEVEFVRKHLSAEAHVDELFWETPPNRSGQPR